MRCGYRSAFRPVEMPSFIIPTVGAELDRNGEQFLLSNGCFRQLLVRVASWPIRHLRDWSVMFPSAAMVTLS